MAHMLWRGQPLEKKEAQLISMKEGEAKTVKVNTGDWEQLHRPRITLPSEWVGQHTTPGRREVEITWKEDILIVGGVVKPE